MPSSKTSLDAETGVEEKSSMAMEADRWSFDFTAAAMPSSNVVKDLARCGDGGGEVLGGDGG